MKKEKSINSIYLILLFVALFILTVVVTINVTKTNANALGLYFCIFDLFIIGALFFVVKKSENEKIEYATNSIKVITINKSTDDKKHVLMCVDNASSDKVVIKLYKDKVLLDESAKLINNKR